MAKAPEYPEYRITDIGSEQNSMAMLIVYGKYNADKLIYGSTGNPS